MSHLRKKRYKHAVGLSYRGHQNETPSLSLSQDQGFADQVVKMAERFGIPVVDRPELARALRLLEVDQEIPEELFEAVAVVLAEIEKRT